MPREDNQSAYTGTKNAYEQGQSAWNQVFDKVSETGRIAANAAQTAKKYKGAGAWTDDSKAAAWQAIASKGLAPSWWTGAPGNNATETTNPGGGGDDGYPYGYGGYGGYGYGGYGGGGGGDSGPTKNQVEMAKLLGPITQWNQNNLLDKAGNAREIYDDAAKDAAQNKEQQFRMAYRKAGSEWHPYQTQLQRVRHQLRTRMGNSAYGSSLLDLKDLAQYQQDVDSRQVLDNLSSNLSDIDNEYLAQLSKIVNGWNEFAMDTQDKARQGVSDYILQLANIHPDLATGKYEGTSENEDEGEKWYESIKLGTAKGAHDVATTASGLVSGLGGNSPTVSAIKALGATENIADTAVEDIANGTAGGSINVAPWLQAGINYFRNNKMNPINYNTPWRLLRPGAAISKADAGPNKSSNTMESSANDRYWKTMTSDYAGSRY